jgi:hypothetical protein
VQRCRLTTSTPRPLKLTYNLTVTNKGNLSDTVKLSFTKLESTTSAARHWKLQLTPVELQLQPQQSAEARMTIVTPYCETEGEVYIKFVVVAFSTTFRTPMNSLEFYASVVFHR